MTKTHGRVLHATPMMHTTFAEMLRERVEALEHLRIKLPWWLLGGVSKRKDQAELTPVERERFLCAFHTIVGNGSFGALVDIHADFSHRMHGTARFLPWHRVYLRQYELLLQSVHPEVTIPYWDWTSPAEQSFPAWLAAELPVVHTPTTTITVARSPGPTSELASYGGSVAGILAQAAFNDFWQQLEGVHGLVHVWVGGTMSHIATAPADPIFWMHHANIDRLWWKWQTSPQGAGKNPPLTGTDAIMDPWSYTEADTRDPATLGFAYL